MVDLVKQLREVNERDFDPASLKTMVLWGADEIERLRAENTNYRASMDSIRSIVNASRDLEQRAPEG